MGGPNLRTDNDSAYADSSVDASVKYHQQLHDAIARVLNLFDVDVAPVDGQALVFDGAAGTWKSTALSTGGTGSPAPTSYATAAPGSVFRILYAGGWPASRPSSRTDIYFDLVGGTGQSSPTWLQPGDNVTGALTVRVAALEQNAGTGGSGGTGTVADATTSAKGVVQLSGDLGGTAASPKVPGLVTKLDIASNRFCIPLCVPGQLVAANGVLQIRLDLSPTSTYRLVSATFQLSSPPTGGSVVIDVNKNGTSMFSSGKPTIGAGVSGITVAGASASTNTFTADGDLITVDIDSVPTASGSTPGANLVILLWLQVAQAVQ